MDEKDAFVIEFCSMLAKVDHLYRRSHIYVEKKKCFKKITTTVTHNEGFYNKNRLKGLGPYTEDKGIQGINIDYSLDAELQEMIDDEKYSIGGSFSLMSLETHWWVQGEVGWSCLWGWDDYKQFDIDFDSAKEVIEELPSFCENLLSVYRELVDLHS